jgi:hypothetical protein
MTDVMVLTPQYVFVSLANRDFEPFLMTDVLVAGQDAATIPDALLIRQTEAFLNETQAVDHPVAIPKNARVSRVAGADGSTRVLIGVEVPYGD